MRGLGYPVLVCLMVVASGEAAAQNLLNNPSFDVDTSGWSASGPGFTRDTSLDAGPNPPFAAAKLINSTNVPFGTLFASQCVPVTGGASYSAYVSVYIFGRPTESGYATISANYYSGAGCSGPSVGGVQAPFVQSSGTTDAFVLTSVTGSAPPTAGSAQVMLFVNKTLATGIFEVDFDLAYFGPPLAPTPTPTPTSGPGSGPSLIPTADDGGLLLMALILAAAGFFFIVRVR
jgi:hypothetical protein